MTDVECAADRMTEMTDSAVDALRTLLAETPDVQDMLRTTMSRQDVIGQGGPRVSGGDQPLPVNLEAGEVLREIRSALVLAVGAIADRPVEWPLPVYREHMALWLENYVDILADRTAGPALLARLARLHERAYVICDRPAERIYLGLCLEPNGTHEDSLCQAELWVEPVQHGDEDPRPPVEVSCPNCPTSHLTADLQSRMMDRLDSEPMSAAHIVLAARELGMPGPRLTEQTLLRWQAAGTITSTPRLDWQRDENGEVIFGAEPIRSELWTFGDVRDAALAELERKGRCRHCREPLTRGKGTRGPADLCGSDACRKADQTDRVRRHREKAT